MNTAKKVLKMGNGSDQNAILFCNSTACTVDTNDQDMLFTFADGSQIRLENGEMFEIKYNTISAALIHTVLEIMIALVMIISSAGIVYLAALAASTLCAPLMLLVGGIACVCSVVTSRMICEIVLSVSNEWRLAV